MPSSKVSPAGGVAVHGSMERSLLDRICRGEAGLAWSCATWPFVIIWTGISFYLGACLHVLLMRAWYGLWGLLCGCCFQYTDGTFQGRKAMGNDDPVDWVRASDLEGVSGKEIRLFEGKIQAADLCQGAVGDCWLVSAFACAAEQPACIRHCFITKEANRRGKYLVKIFDAQKLQWVRITVDDLIPCKNGTRRPLYMKAHQNELWAMLLEKAFAKFCGSYEALSGGKTMWGMRAVTGDSTFSLHSEGQGASKRWKRFDFVSHKDGKDKRAAGLYATEEAYNSEQAWVLLQRYTNAKGLLGASGVEVSQSDAKKVGGGLNGEDLDESVGLVAGHAYSILEARELGLIPGLSLGAGVLGRTKLVHLRNPWGAFEWKGAWGDGSKEWKENPLVRQRLKPSHDNDGSFWMPWDDFQRIFSVISVCDRSTNRDLAMDVHEEMGSCGVLLGCAMGCAEYWLCCLGLRVLYCGYTGTGKTRKANRDFGCCVLGGAPENEVMVR